MQKWIQVNSAMNFRTEKKGKGKSTCTLRLTAVATEGRMVRVKKLFFLLLQKRKQLAPDTRAAKRPKSPVRVGFPLSAFRHNVKDKSGIFMQNQCPETQLSALQLYSYLNKSGECMQVFSCTLLKKWCIILVAVTWCLKQFGIDGNVLYLSSSHLLKGTFAFRALWVEAHVPSMLAARKMWWFGCVVVTPGAFAQLSSENWGSTDSSTS